MGESGSGKSTVAQMVLNLLQPTSGKIVFDGVDTSTLNSKEIFAFRRRVQPIFQDPYGSLDPMYNIFRTIEEPLRTHKIGDKASREKKVRELLDQVALPQSTMQRYPNELSGGQRQRVAIARALALDPEVIICDEAVSALDVLVQAQVLNLLAELQSRLGLTYLFITHDLAVVRQIADHVCVMEKGKLVETGSTDDVFESPQQDYTKALLNAIPGARPHAAAGSGRGLSGRFRGLEEVRRQQRRSRCPPLGADTGSFAVRVPGRSWVPCRRLNCVSGQAGEHAGVSVVEPQGLQPLAENGAQGRVALSVQVDAVRHRARQVVPGEPVARADERQPVPGPPPVPRARPPRLRRPPP